MVRKVLFFLVFVICSLVVWNYELLQYGISQGKGQLGIIMNTKPVKQILDESLLPDSLNQKLVLVQEIRKYAIDSLGINESDNYTTFYDQGGKPILWIVTASLPHKLKAKEWNFPFLGTVSYKGFFELEKARHEEAMLKEQGYDTNINTVSGWSTLGWLKDPILSSMLGRGEGSLSNLIIHELTHGTLYVKDSVSFNENLATFIGDKGAERFLKFRFGENSPQYIAYQDEKEDKVRFTDHIIKGAFRLDSLYNTYHAGISETYKNYYKNKIIKEIKESATSLELKRPQNYEWFFKDDFMPNNAFFMGYLRYNAAQDDFEEEFKSLFGADLAKYLEFLKEKYPSL